MENEDIRQMQIEAGEQAVIERLKKKGLLLNKPEPTPVKNESRAIWDLVIEDMTARDASGALKYGMRLQANNGRDALVDAYQELLDLVVYLRQEIQERRLAFLEGRKAQRDEIIEWLIHRCSYAPPCGRCGYCDVRHKIANST